MTHDPSSFKKVAVLTGLTALIGGAEISDADAAAVSQTDTFAFSTAGGSPATINLSFNGFNTAFGTLTGVELTLNSQVRVPQFTSATTSVEVFGNPFPSSPNPVPFDNTLGFFSTVFPNDFTLNGVSGTATLADYIGGSFDAVLTLTGGSIFGSPIWFGDLAPEGLTVTYTYTPTTPLPATLPLFAAGLAALGFTTWRSRRKQTAKESA
jgi:hypothetical protein